MRTIILFFTGLLLMTGTAHKSLAAENALPEPEQRANAVQKGPIDPLPIPSASGITISRLPNGLTVVVKQDDRFPLVSLRLYVHAGSAYESEKEAGISHLLEHMVFKGTKKRPKGQVAAEIEATGGYLNAGTSFDYTVYLTDMTKDYWTTGMDVLKDMAFQPLLDPAELESEKDVVVAELKRGEDTPGTRLFRMAQQTALKGTPYGHPVIGYERTVRAISSNDMRAYISRLYQPQSMLLLVCGNVEPAEVVAEAGKLFGSLENSRTVTPPSPEHPKAPAAFTCTEEHGPWKKVYLGLTLPAPGFADARSPQLDVLAQLLGGDATSRFYRTYKYEKRLVDDISVSNYSFERLGMLYIQATLDADKVVPFWEAFSRDLARLDSTSFSKEELDRAKLNIEDDLFRSKETLSGYASKLGYFQFFSDGEQGERNYLQSVQDTDQATLRNLIRETFKPESLAMMALLPEGTKVSEGSASFSEFAVRTMAANWKDSKTAPSAESASAAPNKPGSMETIELGKGRTLVLIPDNTLPYAAVNMVFDGGDSLLSPGNQGLGAFTASLLTKGTKKLNAPAMEDFLSDRAASLSAASGRQTFSISVNSPARFTGDMFSLLQETLTSPALKDTEAARVRENQLSAITVREDQPTGLAFRRMFPFFFKDHPYGFLQLGDAARVKDFTAADARAFWDAQLRQPWVIAVCGDFDKDAVVAAVKKLPAPEAKGSSIVDPEWNTDKTLALTLAGRNQAHLFMVFPTVGIGSPDEPGLELLQNILAGQSGLLFRDMRDVQGLGYTVTAFPWKTEKTGALIFYIGTEPSKMAQAEKGFLKVIDTLHTTPLAPAELQRGKNQMTGDYFRDHQSLASRSSEAAALAALHQPLDAPRKLVENAQNVDAKTLQKLTQKYLQPDKAYIIKVLP